MRVFLVRHGVSVANKDWSENTRVADHAIELAPEGHEQARAAGKFLAGYFAQNLMRVEPPKSHISGDTERAFFPKVRLWHSPYKRTRQTAAGIMETCVLPRDLSIELRPKGMTGAEWEGRNKGESFLWDQREHLLLHEQQFGVFDGLSDEEREKYYPREQAYYEKCKKFEGKMWPKMPQGESRADVCMRVHQAFGTFHRDVARHGIENIVVVGHGTTNRAFLQMWLHKPWEWMHQEPNPTNCSVRLIDNGVDKGYIFDDFDHPDGFIHDHHGPNHEAEE